MEGNHSEQVKSQLPLAGVIMCCTSIPPEKRSDLASIACQMGAVHKLDLTSDVTHLIVGDTDTPKYKYVAKERADVKCLLPTWIEAVRQSWLEGGETDVDSLEREYKLPTFTGLRVCVTGFEDLAYRKKLEEIINSNGGEYSGDLTKKITHLIAYKPEGNKYIYARQWEVRIVSIEWLLQSLERGMILDENLFHPLLPVEERGRGAWVQRTLSIASLGKRPLEGELVAERARKLRRTASAKLGSQTEGLWTDIVARALPVGEAANMAWDDRPDERETGVHQVKPDIGLENPSHESSNAVGSGETTKEAVSKAAADSSSQQGGLFREKRFFLHGFDDKKSSVLQKHLHWQSADIVNSITHLSELSTPVPSNESYLLVPHTSSDSDIPATPSSEIRPTVVTDMWVERCLHRKECIPPEKNITSTPFRHFPITGFEKMTICSTGFQGVDLLHMSKAVKLMGATYDEYFTPNATVLVCNSKAPSHEKSEHASLWGIPVVSANWLWECIRRGQCIPFDGHRLLGSVSHATPPKPTEPSPARGQEVDERDKPYFHEPPGKAKRHAKKRLFNQDPAAEKEVEVLRKVVASEAQPRDGFLPKKDSRQPKDHEKCRHIASSNDNNTRLQKHDGEDQPRSCIPAVLESFTQSSDTIIQEHQALGSSNTLESPAIPLQEICHNSTPRPSPSPSKSAPTARLQSHKPSNQESLGTTISSLLSHHQQRNNSNTAPTNSFDVPRPGRRKRHLLGRAPSNLSNQSISLSRASSVDTLNTDGLGTPLEPCISNPTNTTRDNTKATTTTTTNTNYDHLLQTYDSDDEARQEINKPPMTQLGYEDPEVAAWRERMVKKMGGKEKLREEEGLGRRVKVTGTVKDERGSGVRRTRRGGR